MKHTAFFKAASITLAAAAATACFAGCGGNKDEAPKFSAKNYNIADFEAFLERYPNSLHRAEVMQRLATLRRLHATWHNICDSQNPQNFRQFLNNFPDTESEYYIICLHKIASLDWVSACRRMTIASLSGYQQLHPDGEYAMAAALAIDSLHQAEAR